MHEVVGDGRCDDFEAAEGGGGGQSCEEVRAEKARGEARARSIAEVLAARALADAQLVADAEERASGG